MSATAVFSFSVQTFRPSAPDDWTTPVFIETLGTINTIADGAARTFKFTSSALPSDVFRGVSVRMTATGGMTSGNIILLRAKLEEGVLSTPNVPPIYAEDFSNSRRFFRISDVNTRVAEYTHEMRDTPTLSGAGPYNYDAEI